MGTEMVVFPFCWMFVLRPPTVHGELSSSGADSMTSLPGSEGMLVGLVVATRRIQLDTEERETLIKL